MPTKPRKTTKPTKTTAQPAAASAAAGASTGATRGRQLTEVGPRDRQPEGLTTEEAIEWRALRRAARLALREAQP